MLQSYVAVFNGMLSIALKTPKLSYLRKINQSVSFSPFQRIGLRVKEII